MKKQEIKRTWRFFTVADYEKEEQYINEMAREGWHLTAVGFCRYIFRRGEPGAYIYKLDMVERTASDEVKESYFNFLTECDIRIVGEFKEWLYLQKATSSGPFEMEDNIYAKLRHLNKIYSFSIRTICRLLKYFTIAMCMAMLLLESNLWPSLYDELSGVITGIGIGSLFALTLIWVPIISRLRRKFNQLIDEVGIKS
uniref:DUF2812 domain-containing protein n=1 Tax=Alistipes sp. TaxID=1872444 RepID=UPI0040564B46